jgi:putative protease
MPFSYTRKPEIMSPAGHWPQLRAAVEAGADAVYFGLKHFSARAKVGFSLEELPDAMRTLHARGVRGYLTFNTLIFEHEIRAAAEAIAAVAQAGVDALILQDLGITKLAREIAPGLELHASTQMSITDASGVQFARRAGVDRVTLARELSIDEVRAIAQAVDCELEIFVHGALCVAYSGQCFSSEAWGGRSANRGQCAQACRLPYEMLVDGRVEPLGDARYLLSPGDLFALHHVKEIASAGVAALKIEGRYKDADYVALTTSAYRKAVDEVWAGREVTRDQARDLQLEQVYSRGLGPHFVSGTNHQTVVSGRAPRHRGVLMGRVFRVERDAVIVTGEMANTASPLKPGDGVVFDAADWRSPQEPEEGGRLFEVTLVRNGGLELRFGNGAIRFERIRPGDLVWRTHDPDLDRVTRPYVEANAPIAKQRVNVLVTARVGKPLLTEWAVARHPDIRVTVESEGLLAAAQQRGASPEMLREQFARLGNTPYELGDLQVETLGNPFTPVSLLNQVRRKAVDLLSAAQTRREPMQVRDPHSIIEAALGRVRPSSESADAQVHLHLLVRTADQLEAALTLHPASITLDYLDLYGVRTAIERIKAAGIAARVAAPRVLKPGEAKIANFLVSLDCAVVVRSAGVLEMLRGREHRPFIGDFSLNAANSLSAAAYLEEGLERLTPTHDLNADQIAQLARSVGGSHIEAITYQHLPVFHTEHCVFCRFLSTGTSYRDCGRPCEKHRVALRDSNGREHPVLADVGCRNTVFGAEAQEATPHLQKWIDAGIRHLRLEFAHETGEEAKRIVRVILDSVDGRISFAQASEKLRRYAPGGTTLGSLFVPNGYQQLPVLQ